MRRWLAIIAFALLAPGVVDRALAAPKQVDPRLCIKSAVVHGNLVTVCRAVVGGRLILFAFVRHQGIWFLVNAEPAANLPGNPRPSPKS